MSRRPMVAGNWKMNGSRDYANVLSAELNRADFQNIDVLVCPPACFIPLFAQRTFMLAGQNVSAFDSGAHTGEISAQMLASLGCEYVIVGHSERRDGHHESNDDIANKALAALAAGVKPVICVGESLSVREANEVEAFVGAQLAPVLEKLSEEQLGLCVIAYEPIWAIGTGKTATPQQAQDVHAFIRATIAETYSDVAQKIRILYGGSVKPNNAQELFAQDDIDGGLVGGACLDSDSFVAICRAAN